MPPGRLQFVTQHGDAVGDARRGAHQQLAVQHEQIVALDRQQAFVRLPDVDAGLASCRSPPRMASGFSCNTASVLTEGAVTFRLANTLRPPHTRSASLTICSPLSVNSGFSQI
jgi:hypothetical protein